MLCPTCRENNNKVIDSRLTEGGAAIRRRRVCLDCDRRFTTKERVETEVRLVVIKAAGHRVPYDREKIVSGVERACYKLDITDGQINHLVDMVEEDLFQHHDREVSTEHIGRYVGRQLRNLHPVAYVRFMSVHRKYASIDEFIEEIRDVQAHVAQQDPTQQALFDA